MPRSPKSSLLSIYLVRRDKDIADVLGGLPPGLTPRETRLPEGTTTYLFPNPDKPPAWSTWLGLDRDPEYWGRYPGGVSFIPHQHRLFCLTFGTGVNYIDRDHVEPDFGLIVTLNAVDPDRMRDAHSVAPTTGVKSRIQGTRIDVYDLVTLNDERVLQGLTGSIREQYRAMLTSVQGRDSVRLRTKRTAQEIPALLTLLFDLYSKEDYKSTFPWVHNVQQVRDKPTVAGLDAKLVSAFNDPSDDRLTLAVPDFEDSPIEARFKFSNAASAQAFDSCSMHNLRQHLGESAMKSPFTLDWLKRHHVWAVDDESNPRDRGKVSIYKSALFTARGEDGLNAEYYLYAGTWYAVSTDYVTDLNRSLLRYLETQPYPAHRDEAEAQYNDELAKQLGGRSLDRSNISPKGSTQIEPCDVFVCTPTDSLRLIHVKRSTRSSGLSHLFKQGTNAVRLLNSDQESRNKLSDLTQGDSGNHGEPTKPIEVEFVITTHRKGEPQVEFLPLFSRISLKQAIADLTSMKADVRFGFAFPVAEESEDQASDHVGDTHEEVDS